MISIGIIGFGKMGEIRYETIRKHGKGRVVGIYDPKGVVSKPEVRCFESAEELIKSKEIDCIFVCTPNYLNKSLTLQCLTAGKHVFCEKPPAFTAKDVEEVIAVEKICKKKLMYGFNHRHHESIRKARELIDSGAYGRILWMRGRYGKSVDKNFYNDWRSKKELAGGGILMDQGIHLLDLFLLFAGDFEEARAYVSNLYWKIDVEDNVFAILKNEQGIVASLHSTMTQWRHLFSLEIFLEKGYIVINGLLTPSGTYGEERMTIAKNRTMAPAATWDDEEHVRFKINHSWYYEVEHFLDSVEKDKPVLFGTSNEALKLMRLVDKIYESHDGRSCESKNR